MIRSIQRNVRFVGIDVARRIAVSGLSAFFVCAAANVAMADRFRWIGYGGTASPNYAVDWSDAASWTNLTANTGNVCPGDEDEVEFASYPAASVEYDVTPPPSFCGTITGVKSSSNARWFHPRIALADSAGAEYTITGTGRFVASEHLGARIGDGFTGEIEIPDGVAFTIPASVTNAVEFIGPGTVVLTDAAQLDLVSGMTGVIDASGLDGLSISDVALLEGHEMILPANVTIESSRMTGRTVALPDWTAADAWELGGVQDGTEDTANNYTPYNHDPVVKSDGTLLMTDDYSQRNVAWLKTRTFGYDDVWQVKFSYQGSHPADGHPFDLPNGTWKRSQYGMVFGMVIAPGDTGIPVPSGEAKAPDGSYGIRFYNYGNSPNVGIIDNGAGMNVSDSYASVIRDERVGVSQRSAPIDVVVAMRKGRMFVTYSQGTAYRSFVADCSGLFGGDATRRYTIGFFANNGSQTWQHTEISNFSGWCLTQDAGQWTENTACRITTSNWTLNAYTNDVVAANKVDNSDLILDNGDFMLHKAQKKWMSSATCNTALDSSRKVRVDYDIKWGARSDQAPGEGVAIGFVKSSPIPVNGISAFSMNAKYNPISWSYYYYRDRMGFATGGKTVAEDTFTYGCVAGSGMMAPNKTVKCSIVSDGVNVLRGTMVNASDVSKRVDIAAECATRFSDRYTGGMYPHCCGATASSSYIRTDIANFRAYEWNDATPAPELNGGIRVPAGGTCNLAVDDIGLANVTLGAGSSLTFAPANSAANVAIGGLTASGAATVTVSDGVSATVGGIVLTGETPHGISLAGALSFASGAKILLPAVWKSGRRPPFVVVGVTSGTLPQDLVIELDNGAVVDARCLKLSADGKSLTADFHRGLRIVFR